MQKVIQGARQNTTPRGRNPINISAVVLTSFRHSGCPIWAGTNPTIWYETGGESVQFGARLHILTTVLSKQEILDPAMTHQQHLHATYNICRSLGIDMSALHTSGGLIVSDRKPRLHRIVLDAYSYGKKAASHAECVASRIAITCRWALNASQDWSFSMTYSRTHARPV